LAAALGCNGAECPLSCSTLVVVRREGQVCVGTRLQLAPAAQVKRGFDRNVSIRGRVHADKADCWLEQHHGTKEAQEESLSGHVVYDYERSCHTLQMFIVFLSFACWLLFGIARFPLQFKTISCFP
jgi:hypothetical protein